MKKIYFLISFIMLLLLFPLSALAKDNTKVPKVVVLQKDKVVNSDYFAAGDKLILSGTVNGDIYAVGGNIIIDGTVNGDVLTAGGNVDIPGVVNGNVRAAGGNVTISGTVAKNITSAGGSIVVEKSAKISGSLVLAGGNIKIDSPVGKGITVVGGNVDLASTVSGNVAAASVGQLTLRNGTAINGDLTYMSSKELLMAGDATVSGTITHNLPPKAPEKPARDGLRAFNVGFTAFGLLSSFLIGSLLLHFFPKFTQRATDKIVKNPVSTFLTGLVFLIVVPFVVLLLMVTVIGIPLGLLLLVAYIFLLLFAQVFSAIALGKWFFVKISFSSNSYLAFAFGLVLLSALRYLPFVGWVVSFAALVFGLGGYFISKKEAFTQLRASKSI